MSDELPAECCARCKNSTENTGVKSMPLICRLNPPSLPLKVQTLVGDGIAYFQVPTQPAGWCSHFKSGETSPFSLFPSSDLPGGPA